MTLTAIKTATLVLPLLMLACNDNPRNTPVTPRNDDRSVYDDDNMGENTAEHAFQDSAIEMRSGDTVMHDNNNAAAGPEVNNTTGEIKKEEK